MAKKFFGYLYMEEEGQWLVYFLSYIFPSLDTANKEHLEAEFSKEDVRHALCDMKPRKAPDINGIQVDVY